MDANEKYVRERWPRTANAVAEGFDMYGIDLVRGGPGPGVYRLPTPEAAWQAAADFTRARLEEVRQIEEEIAFVDARLITTNIKEMPIRGRILGRLQAILDEKKRGMKESAK